MQSQSDPNPLTIVYAENSLSDNVLCCFVCYLNRYMHLPAPPVGGQAEEEG